MCDGRDDCGNRRDEENCPHVNYQVRLSHDKGHKHMGRVEVKAFGKWGYVCDDKCKYKKIYCILKININPNHLHFDNYHYFSSFCICSYTDECKCFVPGIGIQYGSMLVNFSATVLYTILWLFGLKAVSLQIKTEYNCISLSLYS